MITESQGRILSVLGLLSTFPSMFTRTISSGNVKEFTGFMVQSLIECAITLDFENVEQIFQAAYATRKIDVVDQGS